MDDLKETLVPCKVFRSGTFSFIVFASISLIYGLKMMASLSSLVYLTCQFFRSWCSFFFFFLISGNGFFPPSNLLPLLCFLIVGAGHIESSVSYR
jgi:hypothetical protein